MNQLLFPRFSFDFDDPEQAQRLVDLGVGGFCLFGGTAAEVRALTERLQKRAKEPLLFCADYEHGAGCQVFGATVFPPNMAIAASGDPGLAAEKARVTAIESKALGVSWILAPVLDLATNPSNPIVNTRAFAPDPATVVRFAKAALEAYRAAGVLNCAKHFPGHGDTSEDSHMQLPKVTALKETLDARELEPFRKLLPLTDALMSAHLYVAALSDGEEPFSLSKSALEELARRELGFSGVVVTDSLAMGGVSAYSPEEAAVAALRAGNDILLMPPDPQKLAYGWPQKVEGDPELKRRAHAALERVRALKAKARALPEGDLSIVGSDEHKRKSAEMAQACLAWADGKRLGQPPRRVRYIEPESDGPDEWIGKAFVDELKTLGIEVLPAESGQDGVLIGACSLGPIANAGRIAYFDEELERFRRVQKSAKETLFVSFGTPYIFDQLEGLSAGLNAFSDSEASQRAAARAIAGRIEATGRLPVPNKA